MFPVHAAIAAARDAFAAMEDEGKEDFVVPITLCAELIATKSTLDGAAFKADLLGRREAAVDDAAEAVAAAVVDAEEKRAALTAAEAARAAAVDEPRGPAEVGEGDTPPIDLVVAAVAAAEASTAALTMAEAALVAAKGALTLPAAATKVYVVAPDIVSDVQALVELIAAGIPVRAVINVARERLPPPDARAVAEVLDGDQGESPEEDDALPPLTVGLTAAHAAAAMARDFDAGSRTVAVVPVVFPRGAAGAVGDVPDPQALAALLCSAAGRLAASDLAYQTWRASAVVVAVANAAPDPSKVDMRTYHQLLAGVPHERTTCATVLAALIGQVCASTCDSADVAKAADVAAIEAARAAIAAALRGVKLDAIPEGSKPAAPNAATAAEMTAGDVVPGASSRFRTSEAVAMTVTLLQEGDVMSTLRSTFGPGSLAAGLCGETAVPIASVVKLDPDLVEASMVGLTPAPGTDRAAMPGNPAMDDDECRVRKTAMAAFLPSLGEDPLPLEIMERHELLGVAAGLLPLGLAEDHAAELKGRRHWEPITREAYAAVYAAAKLDLSVSAQAYHAPEDALLTVLHPPPENEDVRHDLPRALTYAEYHYLYAHALTEAAAAAGVAEEDAAATADADTSGKDAPDGDGAVAVGGSGVTSPVTVGGSAAEEAAGTVGTSAAEKPAPTPSPLVPMPAVSYTVETATATLAWHVRRLYPRGGAIVTLTQGGASTVVAGGVTIGLRAGGSITATLADEGGAAISVTRAAATPPGVQVQYTGSSGLCVGITSARSVLQRRAALGPSAAGRGERPGGAETGVGAGAGRGVAWVEETSRAVLANGATVRYLSDGATEVLHADGNTSRREADAGGWVGTNLAGTRWAQADAHTAPPPEPKPPVEDPEDPKDGDAPEPGPAGQGNDDDDDGGDGDGDGDGEGDGDDGGGGIQGEAAVPLGAALMIPKAMIMEGVPSATVVDPDSGAVVTTREDLTMVVTHLPVQGEGRHMVVHADGTRVCSSPDEGCVWRVEKEGFASVQASEHEIAVDLGASVAVVDEEGTVMLTLSDGSVLAASAEGAVAYAPAALNNPSTAAHAALHGDIAGVFLFDLGRGTLVFGDSLHGGFAVAPDGSVGPLAVHEEGGEEGGAGVQEEEREEEEEGSRAGSGAGAAGDGTGEAVPAAATGLDNTPTAPNCSTSAPHVKPRLFVVYPAQEGFFEVLSAEAFSQYAASRASDSSCTVTRAPVAGPEAGVTSHTYLTPLSPPPAPASLHPVPVAAPRPSRPASAGPTIPALRLPSRPSFPQPPTSLTIPRIAAIAPPLFAVPTTSAFVFRQVVEYPPVTAALAVALDAALVSHAAATAEDAATTPAAYEIGDDRDEVIAAAEYNLAARIIGARREKEVAYADRLEKEVAAAEAAEEAAADAAMASGVVAASEELRVAPPGRTPEPSVRPSYPPCNFFAVEEGSKTLDLLRTQPPVKVLPRRADPLLPAPVKRAASEPQPAPPAGPPPPRRGAPSPRSGAVSAVPEYATEYEDEDAYYGEQQGQGKLEQGMEGGHHSPSSSFGRSTGTRQFTDYLGRPRARQAPKRFQRDRLAIPAHNAQYNAVESDARRPLRTTSMTLTASQPVASSQFELSPAHVHFGRVLTGNAVARTAQLLNSSGDLGRFSVRQSEASGPFTVVYSPGMVPAGLAARLKVVCTATVPGDYVGEITISTERHVFVLSLSAKVVGREVDGENVAPAAFPAMIRAGALVEEEEGGGKKGVKAVAEPAVPRSLSGNTVELDENATLADMRLRVDAAVAVAGN